MSSLPPNIFSPLKHSFLRQRESRRTRSQTFLKKKKKKKKKSNRERKKRQRKKETIICFTGVFRIPSSSHLLHVLMLHVLILDHHVSRGSVRHHCERGSGACSTKQWKFSLSLVLREDANLRRLGCGWCQVRRVGKYVPDECGDLGAWLRRAFLYFFFCCCCFFLRGWISCNQMDSGRIGFQICDCYGRDALVPWFVWRRRLDTHLSEQSTAEAKDAKVEGNDNETEMSRAGGPPGLIMHLVDHLEVSDSWTWLVAWEKKRKES